MLKWFICFETFVLDVLAHPAHLHGVLCYDFPNNICRSTSLICLLRGFIIIMIKLLLLLLLFLTKRSFISFSTRQLPLTVFFRF